LHLPDAVDIHAAVAVETLIYRVYGMMSTRVNKNMKVRSLRERHHPGWVHRPDILAPSESRSTPTIDCTKRLIIIF
jgi:hypothetical protein